MPRVARAVFRAEDRRPRYRRAILDRIAAERRAHAFCEVRVHVPFANNPLIAEVKDRFDAATPFDGRAADLLTLSARTMCMRSLGCCASAAPTP